MVPGLVARLGLAAGLTTLWQPQPWSANYAVSKLRAGAPARLLCLRSSKAFSPQLVPEGSHGMYSQVEFCSCFPGSRKQRLCCPGSVPGFRQDGVDQRRLVPRPHPWDVCSRGESGRRGPPRPFRQGPGFVSSVLTAAGAQGPWGTCLLHPRSRRDRAGVKQLLLAEPR